MAKKIRIVVADKIATVAGHNRPIVCGNEDYEVEFTFDETWDNHPVKTARFISNGKTTDVVFEGTTVAVPKIRNTTQISIGVYSGETSTTTAAVIRCLPSVLCPGGVPEEPTPDVYGQLIDLINKGLGGGGGQGGASWPVFTLSEDKTFPEDGYYYVCIGSSMALVHFGVVGVFPGAVSNSVAFSGYTLSWWSSTRKITIMLNGQDMTSSTSIYLAKLS